MNLASCIFIGGLSLSLSINNASKIINFLLISVATDQIFDLKIVDFTKQSSAHDSLCSYKRQIAEHSSFTVSKMSDHKIGLCRFFSSNCSYHHLKQFQENSVQAIARSRWEDI